MHAMLRTVAVAVAGAVALLLQGCANKVVFDCGDGCEAKYYCSKEDVEIASGGCKMKYSEGWSRPSKVSCTQIFNQARKEHLSICASLQQQKETRGGEYSAAFKMSDEDQGGQNLGGSAQFAGRSSFGGSSSGRGGGSIGASVGGGASGGPVGASVGAGASGGGGPSGGGGAFGGSVGGSFGGGGSGGSAGASGALGGSLGLGGGSSGVSFGGSVGAGNRQELEKNSKSNAASLSALAAGNIESRSWGRRARASHRMPRRRGRAAHRRLSPTALMAEEQGEFEAGGFQVIVGAGGAQEAAAPARSSRPFSRIARRELKRNEERWG